MNERCFIDKSKDLSVKRKTEKKREKDDSAPDSGMVPIWGNKGQHSGKTRQVSKLVPYSCCRS
ncbi:hypothetical protein REPUB_Repub15cG0015000 [Reevesia pubescens]